MYSETLESRKTMGDVDVLYHDGIYHLFHLVLPNHDFIAHAVSNNCLSWRRVENALFIGDPGSWDDSMLWTVHVSPDPHRSGGWRMFYTGLSRRDHGCKQRIGMATSDDLFTWHKSPVNWKDRRTPLPYELPGRPQQPRFSFDPDSCFPLEADDRYYESDLDAGRHWVSWRDPFYFHDGVRGWLLTAGRVKSGPVVRRGCVAVLEETSPNHFEAAPPLYHPALYDDVEVPNLFKIDGEYYLIGSLREDAKIRYWHAAHIENGWRSYSDNVLLATGNYAGRVSHDDQGILIWNFFTPVGFNRMTNNLMPPPKRLVRSERGHLHVRSFEGFDLQVQHVARIETLRGLKSDHPDRIVSVANPDDRCSMTLHCQYGFQIFALDLPDEEAISSFRLSAKLAICDEGKCGIAFRLDRKTHDGYYLSLDLFKGVAQMRAWGSGPLGSGEEMMQFQSLQAAYWKPDQDAQAEITLLTYGSYLELSVQGRVLLSLADQTFHSGAIGFCVESGRLQVDDLHLEHLRPPSQSDSHLANG